MNYAQKVVDKTKACPEEPEKLLDRNVIIAEIKQEVRKPTLSADMFELLCTKLCISVENDIEGYQVIYNRGDLLVEIWLKKSVPSVNFANNNPWVIGEGLTVLAVHPALSQEVALLIQGLPFVFPDSKIRDYINKFGGKISDANPVMGNYLQGRVKGKYNGERRYKADFSHQIRPMGSYHILRGAEFKVAYRGNTPTCARCHAAPSQCPGGDIASKCCENSGPAVHLSEHIKDLLKSTPPTTPSACCLAHPARPRRHPCAFHSQHLARSS